MIPQDLFFNFSDDRMVMLLALPFFVLAWRLYYYRKQMLSRLAEPEVIRRVTLPRSFLVYALKTVAALLIWTFATLALMQPKGNAYYTENEIGNAENASRKMKKKGQEVILALDASISMEAKDTINGQSRFQIGKDIAERIISQLEGDEVALYAFTAEPIQMSPLTMDYIFVRLMLKNLHINEEGLQGTNFVELLAYMRDKFFLTHPHKLKSLIIISDGGDTTIDLAHGEDKQKLMSNLFYFLDDPRFVALKVYTVGLGSLAGVPIPNFTHEGQQVTTAQNAQLLNKIAKQGHGLYLNANEISAEDIAKKLRLELDQGHKYADETEFTEFSNDGPEKLYQDYYQLPLGIALLLLIFYLLWPDGILKASKVLMLLFLSYFSSFCSAAIPDELTQAAIYVDAEQYNKAIESYEALLGVTSLTNWEKFVIYYNLGVANLLEGKYERAIGIFQTISNQAFSNPLLDKYLKTNLALAYAQSQVEGGGALKDNQKNLYDFALALREVIKAIPKDCELQIAEGATSCEFGAEDLLTLKLYLKQKIAEKLLNYQVLSTLTLADSLPYLNSSVEHMMDLLNILKEMPSDGNLSHTYKKFAKSIGDQWIRIWESVHKNQERKDQTYGALFENSKKNFEKGLTQFDNNHYASSIKAFEMSKQGINEILLKKFSDINIFTNVSQIKFYFDVALSFSPMQATYINFIIDFLKIIEKHTDGKNKERMHESQAELEKAQQNLPSSVLSTFYLLNSYSYIRQIFIDINPEKSPIAFLAQIIDEQNFALKYQHLLSDNQSDQYQQFQQNAKQAQQRVVNLTDNFMAYILNWQQREYDQGVCLAQPWSEFFPLFSSGKQAALKAASQNGRQVELYQHESLLYFDKAYALLTKPSQPSPCTSDQSLRKNLNGVALKKILEDLIEMEKMDKSKPNIRQSKEKGNHPW